MKPLLIESWLPIAAIGAESERGASSALLPLADGLNKLLNSHF